MANAKKKFFTKSDGKLFGIVMVAVMSAGYVLAKLRDVSATSKIAREASSGFDV